MTAPVEAHEDYPLAVCNSHVSPNDTIIGEVGAIDTKCGICNGKPDVFIKCRRYEANTVDPEKLKDR